MRTGWNAGTRLVIGLFKKFVLADLLAVISFNDLLVDYVRRPGWMWVFLYAYAFRIYFDFSGYTDMAIGMGRLLGVRLPENFAAPYLKPNIALFWNSWHMSLTQWFRSYVFNPLARWLRTPPRQAARVVGDSPHAGRHHGADRTVARHHLELRPVGSVARPWPVRAQPMVRICEDRRWPNYKPSPANEPHVWQSWAC